MKKTYTKTKIALFLVNTLTILMLAGAPLTDIHAGMGGGLFTDPTSSDPTAPDLGTNPPAYDPTVFDTGASGGSLSGGTNTSVPDFNNVPTTPTSNIVACDKNFDDIPAIITYAICTIKNSIIPLLFAVALLIFTWGVVKYVIAGDGSEDREEGRWFMIYGVIGFFVMVSVWGLVRLVSNTIDIGSAFPPQF